MGWFEVTSEALDPGHGIYQQLDATPDLCTKGFVQSPRLHSLGLGLIVSRLSFGLASLAGKCGSPDNGLPEKA